VPLLPVVPGGARETSVAPAPVSSAESHRTVLVVDDEASVRHLMRRWLESRGYAVVLAADADQALLLAAEMPFAVALCDLRMPGHDGLWLTAELRRSYPDTAVIIATGLNDASIT
jgi:CheY-like chemotaxis protein